MVSDRVSPGASNATSALDPRTRLTAWCALASAIAAALGIAFIVIFYAGVPVFGPLNDIAVIIQYSLMLPLVFYVHGVLRDVSRPVSGRALALGLAGILAVIVLQGLLVFGILPFQRQILMVIPAFLVVTAWFVLIERAGREDDRLPKGTASAVLAGLVLGYPFWAFDLRKRLLSNQDLNTHITERI
jgi:uncharacterized membrane protein